MLPSPLLDRYKLYRSSALPDRVNAMIDFFLSQALCRVPKIVYVCCRGSLDRVSYSEMKVASLNSVPSSTVSSSPTFSFRVTLCFLGMYW